jgi:hypothetical protein
MIRYWFCASGISIAIKTYEQRKQKEATMEPNVVREPEPVRLSVDEVLERMSRGEPLAFVDTRNPQAWAEAETKLPEAVRVPADEVDQQLPRIPRDRTIITYCT